MGSVQILAFKSRIMINISTFCFVKFFMKIFLLNIESCLDKEFIITSSYFDDNSLMFCVDMKINGVINLTFFEIWSNFKLLFLHVMTLSETMQILLKSY